MSTTEAPYKAKLKDLPTQPGVYFYYDKNGKIIYIGKAKVLKNRVKSYFTGTPDSPKTARLIARIWDLQTLVTRTEVEALLTEANLIKQHRPRFNIDLRDDKTFPYIRITNEDYPQVFVSRNIVKDGSIYYGPYTNVKGLRAALAVIKRIFTIRSCSYRMDDESVSAKKIQLCLDYHIGKCDGPCQGLITRADYAEMINRVEDFLKGRTDNVDTYLSEKMQQAADNQQYEHAARHRDQLEAVRSYVSRQRLKTSDFEDRDVLGVARQDNLTCGILIRIRAGKLIGKEQFRFRGTEDEGMPSILSRMITRVYEDASFIPREILVPDEIADVDMIHAWLKDVSGVKISFITPQKGEKKTLLDLAERNAELVLKDWALEQAQRIEIVPKMIRSLQEDLNLPAPPRRIEGYDISHLGGTETVASLVCFIDGKPAKREYRKYQIKSVDGIDDFASMKEVIHRRYTRVKAEGLPEADLILIDGGKGQLSAAVEVLARLGLSHIPILGLAKRLEEVFLPGESLSLGIPKTSPSIILLRRIRDEAHRFAITFQRNRRGKAMVHSALDDIEGIGQSRRVALIKYFRSLKNIKNASVEELAHVPGISLTMATRIKEGLE
ncbi:MAG: excinuclease ABC subunit C [Candidatus Marinimicrobia bacterium]|jgi:excinuclease ABC subunit C|nr:excinuclease ABC subunit C [Candidatus Neomarinimicrobiota bacterium]MBT4361505.1 excinuclease ABC subunit C [Candidatus Neomarinimicrobiota bacterium]MBT4713943.1 excinuclease ABC subunit C [Candidatus Neomarinimicrobiota bacterium]MBT4946458.1 excinuclease ABC subunit C [Candidatus Neomarinimicrobiota bacterium]MBT5269550.1 excinuclease ABC subunit C [Candidatus Neomarinimicrobiota bacterium]